MHRSSMAMRTCSGVSRRLWLDFWHCVAHFFVVCKFDNIWCNHNAWPVLVVYEVSNPVWRTNQFSFGVVISCVSK